MGRALSKLFLKRALRTQFDLWRPSVGTRVHTQQATQKEGHDVDARNRELCNGT